MVQSRPPGSPLGSSARLPDRAQKSESDHSAVVRLIAVTVDQHAKNDLTELAEHRADWLEAAIEPSGRLGWSRPPAAGAAARVTAAFRIATGEMRCLV